MSLATCTWISGDEPLLVEEALLDLRQQARSLGYTREIFHIDHHFDWTQFSAQCQSLSLFSDKQFIECHLKQPKLSDEGKKSLGEYLQNKPQGVSVVITSGKLDSSMQKTQWFKKLSANIKLIPIWPLQAGPFRQWLQNRCQQQNVTLLPQAIEYLAIQTEGNLLAAKQAIERVSLLADNAPLSLERLRELQHDASLFDLFDLVDCALSGDAPKTIHIFHQLIAQDTAPVLMLWAIHREVTQLLVMKQGGPTPYILPHRKNLVGKALNRLSEAELTQVLAQCAAIDASLKGMSESDGLNLLLDLYVELGGSIIIKQARHCEGPGLDPGSEAIQR